MTDYDSQHPYLRRSGRLLESLFGDDNNFNDASGNVASLNATTAILTGNMAENESSAPWSTRKTILLAEAIVVTAIVLPLIFCFLYQRASKSGHLPTRSRGSANPTTLDTAGGELAASDRALRMLQLSGEQEQQEEDQPPRTFLQRIASIPSTIGSILVYPFHMIDAGVHSWSTSNEDITFLRSVMERLEEERVAQLEDVEERGERLKMAFSKGDSVWEIAEEHFIPPQTVCPLSPGMTKKCNDEKATATTSYPANEDEEGLVIEKAAKNEELGAKASSEVELKKLDDDELNDDDKLNTVVDAAIDAMTIANDDKTEEESNKNNDGSKGGENNNGEEKGGEQIQQVSSLMMDEINEEDRPISPLMIDEGDDVLGELTPSTPTRSSSPLDIGETPAFLYLPRNRSRTNTNETNTSNMSSLPSSSNHSQCHFSESFASSNHTNSSSNLANSADNSNANPIEEVPNNCAICLTEYVSGDTIVTSCDPMCPHAFHQECIVEWLVKMQVGTPCPCCRRTFVELSPSRESSAATAAAGGGGGVRRAATSPEEEERRREQLRRTIQLGIRRGRTFDFSVISLR